MNDISPFQKSIGELLIDLSEFIGQVNPNPVVAITAIEIYKNKLVNESILNITIEQNYTNEEVAELISYLEEFFRRSHTRPVYIVGTLEIAKNQFLKEIEKVR
jgi:hypothetical protein